jgi:hypothetical protein
MHRGAGRFIAVTALLGAATCVPAQDYEKQLEAKVEELIRKNGKGTDQELKERLIAMAKRDQAVRKPEYVSGAAPADIVQEQERVDNELTAELRQIVAQKGWPSIELVGLQASEDAALILTHSRDYAFQKVLLPRA